jgi:hypothetical protein
MIRPLMTKKNIFSHWAIKSIYFILPFLTLVITTEISRSQSPKAPLIIKPKEDPLLDVSNITSGEEALRAEIAINTNGSEKPKRLDTNNPEDVLDITNPELLKITPISIGKVVGISVKNDKKGTKETGDETEGEITDVTEKTEEETPTLGNLEFEDDQTPTSEVVTLEVQEETTKETTIEVSNPQDDIEETLNLETEKKIDDSIPAPSPDSIPSIVDAPKDSLLKEQEDEETITLETSEPKKEDKSNEKASKEPQPTRTAVEEDLVQSQSSDTNAKTLKEITTEAPTPTEEAIKEALKPEFKKIAADIQAEIDKIKESGREVSQTEREEFKKEFEIRKQRARITYLESLKAKETSQNNDKNLSNSSISNQEIEALEIE